MTTVDDYVVYFDSHSIAAKDLSEDQRKFLDNLNNQLFKIEDNIKV
ncbi:MAG: hypothetical protein J7L73_01935 [Anaerolineales bacterium]|nr:hypothetical protein [Anaerolineales bacterium]